MANEAQYYSPIIQAMIATANRNQQANEFQQTHELAQQQSKRADLESKVQQQRADQEEQRIEYEHENLQNTLANSTKLLSAHLDELRNQALQSARNNIAQGVSPTAYQRQGFTVPVNGGIPIPATPSDQMDIPGYGRVPVSSMPTQQQQADFARTQQIQTAKDIFEQVGKPQDVFKEQLKRDTESEKIDKENAAKLSEIHETGGITLRHAEIMAAAQKSDAALREGGANYRAKLNMGLDPNDPEGAAVGMAASHLIEDAWMARTDPSKWTPGQKKLAAASGESYPNSSDYAKGINGLSDLQQFLIDARKFAENYSTDSPGGGYGKAFVGKFGNFTDQSAAYKGLQERVGELARNLAPGMRMTQTELQNVLTGIVSTTQNRNNNMKNVDDTINQLRPKVDNLLSGASTDRANNILYKKGIVDFGGYQPGGIVQGGPPPPAPPPGSPSPAVAAPPRGALPATPQSPPQAAPKPIAANPGVLSPNDYLKSIGHPGIPQQ